MADETLRESERKFSVIYDKAPFAISLAELLEGIIVDVNDAWVKMYGFSKEEAVGQTSLQLGISRDPEEWTRFFAELEQCGMVRDKEGTWFTKSGAARIISASIEVVAFGGQKYLLSTMHDVTERKRAEQGLLETNAKITGLLESITDAFTAWDREWRYTYVNERAAQFMGKTRDELIGQCVWDMFPEMIGTEAYFKCRQAMVEQVSLHFKL